MTTINPTVKEEMSTVTPTQKPVLPEEQKRLEFFQLAKEVKGWFEAREIDVGYTDTNVGHFALYIQEKITTAQEAERERQIRFLKELRKSAEMAFTNLTEAESTVIMIDSRLSELTSQGAA